MLGAYNPRCKEFCYNASIMIRLDNSHIGHVLQELYTSLQTLAFGGSAPFILDLALTRLM